MQATLDKAVKELYYWKIHQGAATNFTARLYDLIMKADSVNREALRAGFPNEVMAWVLWQASKDETAFFKAHRVPGA